MAAIHHDRVAKTRVTECLLRLGDTHRIIVGAVAAAAKDEVAVDRRNDMDSLMAKMDWLIEQLPVWMVGEKNKHWRRNYGVTISTMASVVTAGC